MCRPNLLVWRAEAASRESYKKKGGEKEAINCVIVAIKYYDFKWAQRWKLIKQYPKNLNPKAVLISQHSHLLQIDLWVCLCAVYATWRDIGKANKDGLNWAIGQSDLQYYVYNLQQSH